MIARCREHHRSSSPKVFEMDKLPVNALSKIFSYLPTLDSGRMMSVCRSWNDILSTSPNLWTRINLPLEMPYYEKAQKIITVFADRSQSRLETISYPAKLASLEVVSILELLESSRATIKKIVLDFSSNQLMDPSDDASSPISFFRSCPIIEELYLGGETIAGIKVETSEGTLTHFSCLELSAYSMDTSLWLSRLKVFEIRECDDSSFLTVLEKCSDLEELRINGEFGCHTTSRMQEIISKSLGKLRILYIMQWPSPCCGGIQAHCRRLEELGTNLIIQESSSVTLNNLSVLHLELPQFQDGEQEGDQRLEVLNRIVKMIESNQDTLQRLELEVRWEGEPVNFSVDQVMEFLRVNIVLGAPCPKLSNLSISSEITCDFTLLAQVLLSRRLLSLGYSPLAPKGTNCDSHSRSELSLCLEDDDVEDFEKAEREVLSKCPEWIREAAGEASIMERVYFS